MVYQIGDNSPDGMNVGLSTSEKVSFYGVTPVVQPASASQAVVTATSTKTTTVLRAQLDLVIVLANQMRLDLISTGLIKGAA